MLMTILYNRIMISVEGCVEMKVNFMIHVSDHDIRMEKEIDFNDLLFMPRKGDLIESEVFSYSGPVKVEDVIIYLDHGFCNVFLSKHNLMDNSVEHLEEVITDYEKKGWIKT